MHQPKKKLLDGPKFIVTTNIEPTLAFSNSYGITLHTILVDGYMVEMPIPSPRPYGKRLNLVLLFKSALLPYP
ncbi:hypothetical protein MJO29_006513 [Puccinia striiformis f. sp. tritici]|nr:hypothetical protein MJO29_006513 [Puccinia striiformis f. sp. tritici]KAI9605293.1 hypothetical protein H4Q26_003275 [Puccinia striiformis f. sp. tritici PST-130]